MMRASSTPGSAARAQWLMHEIGSFLADDREPWAFDAVARNALRNGHDDFQSFAESRCAPDEVVLVQLEIVRNGGPVNTMWYRQVPPPIGLLVACAGLCTDRDVVRLVQITASLARVTAEEQWPFGVAAAEQMTIPATVRVRAAVAGAADEGISPGSAAPGSGAHRADG
jgi:hypothetical protein